MYFHILLLATICFISAPSLAQTMVAPTENLASNSPENLAEKNEHINSAFLFASRRQWNDALLHAKRSNEPALQTLVEWQYLLDKESGASFAEIKQFIAAHPDWSEQKKLRIRAEMAMSAASLSDDEIINFFKTDTPITGVGKIALLMALQHGAKQPEDMMKSLVREAWRDGDFDEEQEKNLLSNYGAMLRKEDDIARTDRLLWEGKTSAAERMFARVDDNHIKLYKARIALQADKKDAKKTSDKLLTKLPASLKKDAGLLYDKIVFNAKHDNNAMVREMLLAAPKKVPYPEKWWKYRERQIRDALDDRKIALASLLLANHGQEKGKEFADASWLRGWIFLRYQNRAKDAYSVFYHMFDEVKYPVSKARAAYGAARAARVMGDAQSEKIWLEKAAKYPTAFYGQLASLALYGDAPLKLPAPPIISDEKRAEFMARSLVKAIKLCLAYGEKDLAGKLINGLVEDGEAENASIASELGLEAGKPYLSVRAAKKAFQNNIVLISAGYPTTKTPDGVLPRALTLAITRQESEFDRYAKSPSGALGLMQLLPSTAKEVAQKNEIGFIEDGLYQTEYNMRLGSLYLARLIDNYDGSLVMAIAAYNAGLGNVYKWTKKIGKPTGSLDKAVDWIEAIPFSETRNYVQRVIENLQIYRQIEATDGKNKLLIGEDLRK